MFVRIQRRQLIAAAGLALLWRSRGLAQGSADPIDALLALSDCCLVGRPVAAESSWVVLGGARRIATVQDVRVEEVLGGHAARGDVLRVRTLGGRVGEVVQRVFGEAELAPGRPALLFLARIEPRLHVVADGAGGCYAIEHDGAGAARLRADAHALGAEGQRGAMPQLHGITLTEARRTLSLAVRGARAR